MPGGSLKVFKELNESTPLSKLLSPEQIQELKEKALDPDWLPEPEPEEEKLDPMDIAPDMRFICEELKKKGGIRFDNCQEFGLFWDLLDKSDYPDDIKNQSKMILGQVLNFANMWIIHYNNHKD